ncbi:MAG: lactonase family protein [Planctomycetes bacterium]|nr:lactonase family protein [Planctomycetota bacterium]
MADAPRDRVVFISAFAKGDDGAIHAFLLDGRSGTLKPLAKTGGVEEPFFLALSRDRRFLYSIHRFAEGHVAAFAIEPGDQGALRLINRQPSRSQSACYLDIDATGKTVLTASYGGGSVTALPVNADGSLGEPTSHIQHVGFSNVDKGRQEAPHAHCIVISPDNRFAYAADLGLDQIINYKLDAARSTLTPNRQPFVRTLAGAGPRHFTFHPTKPFAYAINELHNSVTMFDYDPETGTLIEQQTITTLPADFKTGSEKASYTADVKITPDGRFLYGTNRGHESIAGFAIGADDRLSSMGITPSGSPWPQNLAITPDGAWMICANMMSDRVTVFTIDRTTGAITLTGEPVAMPKPSCVMVV